MCGIFCALSTQGPLWPSPELQHLLQNRGPDSCDKTFLRLPRAKAQNLPGDVYISSLSTVLSLRGSLTVTQPYRSSDNGSILCWNGEAWSIGSSPTSGNDTEAVYKLLTEASQVQISCSDRTEDIMDRVKLISQSMSRIAGPYAFVFLDHFNNILYFGRDFLGRRSLLSRVIPSGDMVLSSVSDAESGAGWSEVEADGVYCVDLLRGNDAALHGDNSKVWGRYVVTKAPYHYSGDANRDDSDSVVPRLLHSKEIPLNPIQLNPSSPSVSILEKLLRDSLSLRVLNIPDPPFQENGNVLTHPTAKLAILFSGGLDCTVLACLSHHLVPIHEPIDLLNVAFENPRVHKTAGDGVYELCPDRITGRASHTELQRVCPGRLWRFVAVNVPYSETIEHRQKVITLMYPHNTEMDLSICLALYFASRGIGMTVTDLEPSVSLYTTPARVLLSGLGADELFAGYTRHATVFSREGLDGLLGELDLDIGRLGSRNMGRDDRIISNWGREARFPFLDEHLLRWALAAFVNEKCGFGDSPQNDTGVGDVRCGPLEPGKKALRCLAWKVGLTNVAREKKRAIQFGARTAKMETGKTKGTTLLS